MSPAIHSNAIDRLDQTATGIDMRTRQCQPMALFEAQTDTSETSDRVESEQREAFSFSLCASDDAHLHEWKSAQLEGCTIIPPEPLACGWNLE